MNRHLWTLLTDPQLLAQCEVDTYRASGPGGQKRNKTSSAVRLRHPPTGLIVIAEESRSQHENRARALKRMRQALFLKLREAVEPAAEKVAQHPDWVAAAVSERLELGRKDVRFWPVVALILDLFEATQARVSDVARALNISTGNLIDFLSSDPKVWEQANILRHKFNQKPLRPKD